MMQDRNGVKSVSTLVISQVRSLAGENLGKVEEIMADVSTGTIAYAIVTFDGCPELGKKLFPLPWGALTFHPEERCFILKIDQDKLRLAPGFDEDHWPDMADHDFADEISSYYSEWN